MLRSYLAAGCCDVVLYVGCAAGGCLLLVGGGGGVEYVCIFVLFVFVVVLSLFCAGMDGVSSRVLSVGGRHEMAYNRGGWQYKGITA